MKNLIVLLLSFLLFIIVLYIFNQRPVSEENKIEINQRVSTRHIVPTTSEISTETTESEVSTEVTRDCRSWSQMEYFAVQEDGDDTLVIKNDAENHNHRLNSWIKKWKSYPDTVPKSGIGSTLPASRNLREGLDKIVDYLKKESNKDRISILDSSCGDMTWMPTFLHGRPDVDYTGYDLLPVNINAAREIFKNETAWIFHTFDLVKDKIEDQFDLIINRHTAIHLGLHDNIQMFHNFYQSGSKYLLTTTFPHLQKNTQLFLPGDRKFHEKNLSVYPFKFPVPLCQAPDATPAQFYALWDLSSLEDFEHRHADKIRSFG